MTKVDAVGPRPLSNPFMDPLGNSALPPPITPVRKVNPLLYRETEEAAEKAVEGSVLKRTLGTRADKASQEVDGRKALGMPVLETPKAVSPQAMGLAAKEMHALSKVAADTSTRRVGGMSEEVSKADAVLFLLMIEAMRKVGTHRQVDVETNMQTVDQKRIQNQGLKDKKLKAMEERAKKAKRLRIFKIFSWVLTAVTALFGVASLGTMSFLSGLGAGVSIAMTSIGGGLQIIAGGNDITKGVLNHLLNKVKGLEFVIKTEKEGNQVIMRKAMDGMKQAIQHQSELWKMQGQALETHRVAIQAVAAAAA